MQKGIWVDDYTGAEISMKEWLPGYPVNDTKQGCAVYGAAAEGYVNYECSTTEGDVLFSCSCDFPKLPFLTLRGRCKDSFLDHTYLPQNNPLDGETTFYGTSKTIARFLKHFNYNF